MTRLTDERAVALLQAGDLEGLLREARAHINRFPEEMTGHYFAGRALFMIGQDSEAQQNLSRAIEVEENDRPYFWRGLSRMHTGDEVGAEADLRQARTLNPNGPHIGYELGRLLARLSRFDEARHVLEQTLQHAPGFVPARYNLGTVCGSVGDHDAARRHWLQVLEQEPGHVDAAYNLGVFHQNRGQPLDAVDYFEAAAAGGDPGALAKVVQCNHQASDFQSAAAWLERAVDAARTAGIPRVCIDQFRVDDIPVIVYRILDDQGVDPPREVVFHFVTDDRILKSINVEYSAYGAESGGAAYLLGEDRPNGHVTYAVGWKDVPDYQTLRDVALAAHRGEIEIVASSTVPQ